MQWAPATAPSVPTGTAAVVEVVSVDDALVTAYDRGWLRLAEGRQRWMTGAVHDRNGVLVPASQRLWRGDPLAPMAADPDVVRVPDGARRLSGRWLYAGHNSSHFGHWLVEVLTNLWPDPAAVDVEGLLLHRTFRGPDVPQPGVDGLRNTVPAPWQRDLLRLAGYGDVKVRAVRGLPVRVDHLMVPSRPVLLKSWALPPAVEVWRRVSDAVGQRGEHRRVYLSRRHFHARQDEDPRHVRVGAAWEDAVESAVADAGFAVVHPEELAVAEQVRVVRGAEVLAGPSGSALHQSAFAAPGTRVLEIGDARSRTDPMPSQRLVDAACGHLTAFVAHDDIEALHDLLLRLDH